MTRQALNSSGRTIGGWLWDEREELDRNRFPDHEGMAGQFSTDPNDFDGVFVGDHVGCLCAIVPVITKEDT